MTRRAEKMAVAVWEGESRSCEVRGKTGQGPQGEGHLSVACGQLVVVTELSLPVHG